MTIPAFDPEKLVGFIQELHRHGFVISTQQYTTAQDLLISLVAEGRVPADPQNLSTWLAPVFCTSPEEQRVFHKEFKQWLKGQTPYKVETGGIEYQAGTDSRPEVKDVESLDHGPQPSLLAPILTLIILVTLITLIFRPPKDISGIVSNNEDERPVRYAAIMIGDRRIFSNENGQFILANAPEDLPIKVSVSHTDYEPKSFELNTFPNLPLSITLKKLATPSLMPTQPPRPDTLVSSSQGYMEDEKSATMRRRFRSWAEIYRDPTKLLLIAIVLLPLLFFGAWWVRNLRRLRLMKQSSDEECAPHSIKVKGATVKLFREQALRRMAQEMRRHRQFGSDEIDPLPTVNATIREGLRFTPVYGLWRERPEYLALIDRAGFDDHQAQLEDALINRLVEDGVLVERYYFHGSPLVCRQKDPKAPHIDLQELRARYPNHLLLLFSDGDGLIDTLTAEPRRWLDALTDWPVSALLTPREPANWDYKEWILSEQGFVIIPASKQGIAALIETIHTNKIPRLGNANNSQPFPELLYERPERWLEHYEPERAFANQLCFQLRRFLGDEGYYLLGACAVYPMLHWNLTLHLAYELGGPDGLEERLRLLVQLPWFRHGSMPDWLRLRLISALPKEYEELTRQALIELLDSPLKKTDGGSLEEPGSSFELPYVKGLRDGFIKEAQAWNRRKLWQVLIRLASKQSPLRDYVFLTFMSDKLALNVPDALRRALFPEGQPVLGLRSIVRLLLAVLCSVVIFLALSSSIFNVSVPIAPRVVTRHFDTVYSVAFTTDGEELASASSDETVKICHVSADDSFPVMAWLGLTPQFEAVSPDRKVVARVNENYQIKLWEVSTGNELATLRGHSALVYCITFSPDGKSLASGSLDKTVKLWDVGTGNELATLRGHSALVYSVAFSPDGKVLTSSSLDKTVKLWDVATLKELRSLGRVLSPFYSVAFSSSAKVLASGSGDATVKLWDVGTGKLLATLTGHSGPVYCVAFSPDGKSLASASQDKTVKLWDVGTGKLLAPFNGHSDIVTSVAFSPDGKSLASASQDKTVRLWDLTGIIE